jgi:surface polysaccharide O-acyltransferase-like enzyme
MKMETYRIIALILVLLGMVFTSMGGWKDMTLNKQITKQHYWNDGTYLTVLAIFILLYFHSLN